MSELEEKMTSNVTIYASSRKTRGLGFFNVKSESIKLEEWERDASRFRIVRVKSDYGRQYGYNEKDKLAIIVMVSKTGLDVDNLVATVNVSDPKNWKIVFEKANDTNVALFKLTRKDLDNPRTGYLWHRNQWDGPMNTMGEERVLRLGGGVCKQLTFSDKKFDPVIIHVKKPNEGSFFFTNDDEFF